MNDKQGWGNPEPFKTRSKFHFYAADGRSLCGRWGRLFEQPEVEDTNDNHLDNCAACKKKIEKYRISKRVLTTNKPCSGASGQTKRTL